SGDRATQNVNTLRRLAAEGGTGDIEPPMTSMIRAFSEANFAIFRNRAANAFIQTMRQDPLIGPWLERKPLITLRTGREVGGMQQPTATIVDWRRGDQPGAISRFVGGKRESWGLREGAPEPVRRAFAQIEDIAKSDDVPNAGMMAGFVRGLNTPLRWGA